MSEEIKVQPDAANRGITDMRSSTSAIPTTFAKEIEGENKLDMVREYNEIKQEYDDLLTQFENIFHQHLQASEEAVEKYQETDQHVANAIRSRS
ncbi:hypothetical protein J2Z83_002741 [Virgibacillus natechei]|uniref:TIGR04197 family type VII secretion effector n=1 Tax=Virgibacillus natechei TaxID=1216297 RepID=A0ABS4II66_9BACI|nr:YwqI/YxiC family protein [Virgibacillus natechei]MBP1970605.1 hypothetical protein [Virgibacillus natechei]UZD14003.1 YwqI/YxiC family protein [Virgibacillus natechei]